MPALKIFSESIKFFKEHFEHLLEKITLRVKENERNMSGDVSESVNDNDERKVDPKNNAACSWSADILWVLTVPAIWSDEAKQFMREAAIQAGIQDDHLVLALEPESAALLCKQLKLTENSNATNIEEFEIGSKFMVVDCVDGTVNVTSFEVNENSSLKELHCASEDTEVRTNSDELFFDLLNRIFGKDVINTFKCHSPSDWLELVRSFEAKKQRIGRNYPHKGKTEYVTFSNLGDLFTEYAKFNENRSVVSKLQEMRLTNKIKTFSSAKLRISENFLIEKVFHGPIEDVTGHLKDLYIREEITDHINIILLVGDFSECPLLEKAIRSQFPNRKVINPQEGSVAVMKGAVLFGHSPENLMRKSGLEICTESTRITRKSSAYYGVATDVPFIEGEHLPLYRSVNQAGNIVCTEVFKCLISKNQELVIGETCIEMEFNSPNFQEANIEIYRANREVQYCTEKDCTMIGRILAGFSDCCHHFERRPLKIQLQFGLTEKKAIAIDLTTNKSWEVKLDCLL